MLDRLVPIGKKILAKLEKDSFLMTLEKEKDKRKSFFKLSIMSDKRFILHPEINMGNVGRDLNMQYFLNLIRICCTYNFIEELDELLETCKFQIDATITMDRTLEPSTLLGLAAFHGHYDLIKYLVEKRKANINHQDILGNTALHQAVYGDGFPDYSESVGKAPDQVAAYLIANKADLSIKNFRENESPVEALEKVAPTWIEKLLKKRTDSKIVYGDKVSAIFEKVLKEQKASTQDLNNLNSHTNDVSLVSEILYKSSNNAEKKASENSVVSKPSMVIIIFNASFNWASLLFKVSSLATKKYDERSKYKKIIFTEETVRKFVT